MSFLEVALGIIRQSGASTRRLYLGLGFRLVERILTIAPFFLAFVWFDQALASAERQGDLAAAFSDAAAMWPFLSLLLLMLLGQLIFAYLGQLESFLGAYELTGTYRERLINQIRSLPLGPLQQQSTGRLASVLTEDVNRVEKIFTHLLAELLAAAVVPLFFLIVLAVIDWRLAASLAATLPLAVLALILARRVFLRHSRRNQEQMLNVSGLLVEFVSGILTFRLFNRAGEWLQRLDRHFNEIRSGSLVVEAWGGGPVQVYRLVLELSLAAMLLTGVWLATIGELNLTVWLLFTLVAYKLLDPLLDAAAFLTELRAMAQSGERIQALLDHPLLPEPQAPAHPEGHDVVFSDVGFRYQDDWVLRDISFEVPQGSITALVGPSGSGKTTLMHLLARFYDPQEGAIRLGGVDLRQLRLNQLYGSLSLVFQDVQLFKGSILENVRIGRPDADDEAVIAACRAAYCHGFVDALPEGYHTQIGENGQRLSGGERQRLSIARALLKDAPLLLLDEATASVDADAQHEIQRALSRLVKGRSVIVVAHRLRTVRHAGQILVLDRGRIADCGTHDQLLARQGLYQAMWRAQTSEDDGWSPADHAEDTEDPEQGSDTTPRSAV